MKKEVFKTSWGWVGIASTVRGVRAVVLPRPSRRAAERELRALIGTPSPTQRSQASMTYLKEARSAIAAYLEGKTRDLDLPLDLQGHPRFRAKVWEILKGIPYGRVRSYGWIARKVGKPKAARAVGGACGANPVPLLIPCHRVVAGDGSLGGFSGGLSLKKRLLKLEGIIL